MLWEADIVASRRCSDRWVRTTQAAIRLRHTLFGSVADTRNHKPQPSTTTSRSPLEPNEGYRGVAGVLFPRLRQRHHLRRRVDKPCTSLDKTSPLEPSRSIQGPQKCLLSPAARACMRCRSRGRQGVHDNKFNNKLPTIDNNTSVEARRTAVLALSAHVALLERCGSCHRDQQISHVLYSFEPQVTALPSPNLL